VLDRLIHSQPVEFRLLACDDDVDVVAAAQAVVADRQQRVSIRKVDADDFRLLVHDVVDEARVLMREAVVILAPNVRGEQVVQRGDRPVSRYPSNHPWHRCSETTSITLKAQTPERLRSSLLSPVSAPVHHGGRVGSAASHTSAAGTASTAVERVGTQRTQAAFGRAPLDQSM